MNGGLSLSPAVVSLCDNFSSVLFTSGSQQLSENNILADITSGLCCSSGCEFKMAIFYFFLNISFPTILNLRACKLFLWHAGVRAERKRGAMWSSLWEVGVWALSLGSCVCLDRRSCLCSLESRLGAWRVCLDWNLNWFVHLPFYSFSPSLAAAVCHLNNKCRWFPDLVRGSGLWCILILPHRTPFQGPSLIWIKEVEFENSQCFTWIQIASIYCSELWNSR